MKLMIRFSDLEQDPCATYLFEMAKRDLIITDNEFDAFELIKFCRDYASRVPTRRISLIIADLAWLTWYCKSIYDDMNAVDPIVDFIISLDIELEDLVILLKDNDSLWIFLKDSEKLNAHYNNKLSKKMA